MSQEIDATEKCYTDSVSNFDNEDKPTVTDNDSNTIKYFLPGPNSNNDKKMNTDITEQLQKEFKDVFNGTGCFNGTFLL